MFMLRPHEYYRILSENISNDLMIYNIVRKILSLPFSRDLLSPLIGLTLFTPTVKWNDIKNLLYGKRAVIVGAGPNVLNDLKIYNDVRDSSDVILSADGAVKAVLEYNLKSDIVVTDLDGDPKSLMKAYELGSKFIVLCHGDNIDKIIFYSKIFRDVFLTSQIISLPPYILNLGGFTDGDRAIYIASRFKAKNILLIGMDYNSEIGLYSLGTLKDLRRKRIKLKIADALTRHLIDKYNINLVHNLL